MKAEEAAKIALQVEGAEQRYRNVISNIRTIAENGCFRMAIPYPGREVAERLMKDGYFMYDALGTGAPSLLVISW